MMRLIMLLVCGSGCGLRLVDPCAGVVGTCLSIQVQPGSSSTDVDSLDLQFDGDGLMAHKIVGDGARISLPVAVAAKLDTLPKSPTRLTVTVTGSLGGSIVGMG